MDLERVAVGKGVGRSQWFGQAADTHTSGRFAAAWRGQQRVQMCRLYQWRDFEDCRLLPFSVQKRSHFAIRDSKDASLASVE